MYNHFSLVRLLVTPFLATFVFLPSLLAQDINTEMSAAQNALKNKEFEKAQSLLAGVITNYGEGAQEKYGARFGSIFYKKGVCELILAEKANRSKDQANFIKWSETAATSLETCYKNFSNAADVENKSTNVDHRISLQRWADAMRNLGKHDEAIKLYKQFIDEREQRDKYHPTQGGFYANLAISYYSLETPNIAEGNLYFGKALEEKRKLKTPERSVVTGFLALTSAVVKTKNEDALIKFLDKHRTAIMLEPFRMNQYSTLVMKIASEAIKNKMFKAAYTLYGILPESQYVVEDINAQISQLPKRKGVKTVTGSIVVDKLKTYLTKVEEKKSSGDPDEVAVLMGMTYLNEQAKNYNGVYACLKLLETNYNKSKHREANLFNLIRMSSVVGKITETSKYGDVFLKSFPDSKRKSAVNEMMLTSLFFGGNYEESLVVAEKIKQTVKKNTEQHDMCLFVLAGSKFYLGEFEEAKPLLAEHLKLYPNSQLTMHASYYNASNYVRLYEWSTASKLLNEFIQTYENTSGNVYLPNALYDLASCNYREKSYEAALKNILRIEKDFANASILDNAYNLKGNIYESTKKPLDAEQYYTLALKTSEQRGNKRVAAESLFYLVTMLSSDRLGEEANTRQADALPFYDQFLKKYADSPYKPQIVVLGLPSMKVANRYEEGLDNIKAVIIESAATEKQFYLEESVNAFSDAYLEVEGNTPDKLKNVFYSLNIDLTNMRALALLRISVISAYEKALKGPTVAGNDKLKLRYESSIKALFKDLKTTFKPQELTNYILLRIGDYLREKTSAPKQSLAYYEELLKRKDKFGQNKALLGVADVKGSSNDSSDKKEAIDTLETVLEKSEGDASTQSKALGRLVELYADQNNWVKTEEYARRYLEGKIKKKAPEVGYLFALSFDKRGMNEDALANYAAVYARYGGYIKISAPSVKRVMEIMWKRNYSEGKVVGKGDKKITLPKSDRQSAYEEIGARYIASTQKIRKTNTEITEDEKAAWDEVQALVKKYENSGNVKTLEQIKKEASRRTR